MDVKIEALFPGKISARATVLPLEISDPTFDYGGEKSSELYTVGRLKQGTVLEEVDAYFLYHVDTFDARAQQWAKPLANPRVNPVEMQRQ